MGDLTELIREKIEAKRKEVENRYQQNYKELNKKHQEEEAAHEIVDSDGNDNTDNENNYDNESLSNIDRPDQSINNSHKCDGNDGKDINDLTSKIVINSINHNDIGNEEDDENYVLNDRRPSYNHLTNGKMEIIKANYKLKKLENKYKNIGETYQKTFQEFDEFEQNLTAISDEFENNQKHALLNLVKGFNDNKRKIEKEVEGEEVSTSKKVKYVAAGAGIAGLLSLAPWVLDNLPLLQQHLQNLPFI
nr:4518_t:CDS:2 [Entrophospora candida]